MFEIDCTAIPKSATDFAFDHLRDDIENDDTLTINYDSQTVQIDTGNMDFAYEVRNAIQKRAEEKLQDMKFETKQGYDTGHSVNELNAALSAVRSIEVTA